MKITPASDIHLEFGQRVEMPGGEVLLLAGDVVVAQRIEDHKKWVARQAARYDLTILTDGNHTHYAGGNIQTDREKLADVFQDVEKLHYDQYGSLFYQGVLFVWAPLWTDFNGQDPRSMQAAGNRMNDYRTIFIGQEAPRRLITPEDILAEHVKHLEWIKYQLTAHRGYKTVVMTHHSPSKKSTHPIYKDDVLLNGAYSTDLEYLMREHPQVVLWVHGHTHHSFDYKVGNCRIVCNPRGYEGHGLNPEFNPSLVVEV